MKTLLRNAIAGFLFFQNNTKLMPPKSAKAATPFDPKTQMIILKLESGHEFYLDKQCANLSGYIKERIDTRLNLKLLIFHSKFLI